MLAMDATQYSYRKNRQALFVPAWERCVDAFCLVRALLVTYVAEAEQRAGAPQVLLHRTRRKDAHKWVEVTPHLQTLGCFGAPAL